MKKRRREKTGEISRNLPFSLVFSVGSFLTDNDGRGRRIRTRDPRFWRNCIQSQKFYVSKRKSALDKGGMTTNCRRLWQKKCQQGLFVLAVDAWRFPFPVKFSGNSRLHNIWAGNKLQSTDKASDSQRNLNAETPQIPTCRG